MRLNMSMNIKEKLQKNLKKKHNILIKKIKKMYYI
jgi:hypothetical protein